MELQGIGIIQQLYIVLTDFFTTLALKHLPNCLGKSSLLYSGHVLNYYWDSKDVSEGAKFNTNDYSSYEIL